MVIALTLVSFLLVYLVEQIESVVHSGVPDQFLGLILLPLVEKAAEHLTAIDEAWDGTMVSMHRYLIDVHYPNDALELGAVPLPGTINTDCLAQCSSGRDRRMDH